MFNNSSKILFITIMIIGTLITVTSNSWLGAWMGLEINLLSFIPLLSDNNNLMSTEASLKYFLTQVLASTVLLFSSILLMLKNNMNNEINESFTSMIIMSALLLKSGAAPFHFWFPNMMEGLTWMNALMLMTWQKIAPLMLISYLNIKYLLLISVILSVIIGAIGGLNQTSLRKLMAFSSINHLGWMLSSLMISESIWLIYFFFYSFLSFVLTFMFNIFKLFHLNQLFSWFVNSKILKFTLFMNFLSLGGLPPFLGFLPKWLVIQQLTLCNQYFMLTLMMMSTLITLFFYLRICYSAFMMNYFENNWIMKMNMNSINYNMYMIMTFFSIFGLFLISLFYFMF
uniref:NADH-ubiquinone oxidoreductase chain 2 n=3 Tax=Drosophila melanogaster TaxID=7227 RepID=NU2M_DROME|nr:NADH dehydrogenase subunit 2 [Drosophila melanogaster]P03896.3 RecName: Full=NADH-ubiquinone oxidoreductase chain 2; AltName: Full=NADH dehydrogenase subunit 2 [Drosophila melanogaster]8B9Z_N Chain N, NADH-ubiquinone oxidoreductase chain 2 [Drosophila melanogaster]8BA0_N Chain N, NADH-ubiquinone oxidoreductase chain 2 [Drosophila melanogaster]8ESW_2 Chain 2, NADH-ubiquinone oxidoreductase chain 2 [Drosophila melanogaster]8ESZ_2 Chain 2, NADH-ubiquinone oxidoreductase chain 2 [Drosophila mel|eukprot:YP_009047266.1 NADH dehydrogenase subunit 2 (mitochondrion) [Drosophila melanogaster]